MGQSDWVQLSLHITAMLAAAIVLGQLFRRMGLPALAGEVLGGILLGPTLLGRFAPEVFGYLFPPAGPVFDARTAMMRTGMLCFIVTIGLGISLAEFRRISKKALGVGTVGTFVPLFIGVAVAYGFAQTLGFEGEDKMPLALFIGAILSLSANPIIARILMDLGVFQKEIGKIIMSATLVDDLVGWGLFAFILTQVGPNARGPEDGVRIFFLVVSYVALVLVMGKVVLPPILRLVQRSMPQPSGLIGAVIGFTLLAAAGSEALGLHSFLGAFLMGIGFADVYEEFKEAFDIIGNFTLAFITPVFFLSMGIAADFYEGFNFAIVAIVTIAAFFGKILGVYVGGRAVGMPHGEALAVGCGLNARGILGMVMAAAAFESKLINEQIYVACILMCLLTTMAAGPALLYLIRRDPSVATGGRRVAKPG